MIQNSKTKNQQLFLIADKTTICFLFPRLPNCLIQMSLVMCNLGAAHIQILCLIIHAFGV